MVKLPLMFTGIIEEIGQIKAIRHNSLYRSFEIIASKTLEELKIGDSIAVNGVCLTVVDRSTKTFTVEVISETLRKTTLGRLTSNSPANLERAIQANSRFGGHFVSGHVDAVGIIREHKQSYRSAQIDILIPREIARFIVPKGSVCIDGISLTVVNIEDLTLKVAIVPHTLKETTLGKAVAGTKVNIEVDLLAKHLDKLGQKKSNIIDDQFLESSGWGQKEILN